MLTANLLPDKNHRSLTLNKSRLSSSLMPISKSYSRIAVISLLSLATAAPVWAEENGGEIDSFNRSLGLEGMGTDLASVERELEHGSSASTPEPQTAEGPNKAPAQKREPVQHTSSFSNLAFRYNPTVTNSTRAYYVSHMNAQTLVTMPTYDALISRFDQRFAEYGFSKHNLGDTVAGYLIISWEIVHDADASNSPQGIRRVREAVCQIIEQRGKATRLSDDQKQKFSELIKSISELVAEQSRRNLRANNQAAEAQLRNQVVQAPLKLGIDLRRWRLTEHGFVNG
jgi:hypothetical protein